MECNKIILNNLFKIIKIAESCETFEQLSSTENILKNVMSNLGEISDFSKEEVCEIFYRSGFADGVILNKRKTIYERGN